MKIQALLITERVLGKGHKDTIFRYMYAGATHADSNEYVSDTLTQSNFECEWRIEKIVPKPPKLQISSDEYEQLKLGQYNRS